MKTRKTVITALSLIMCLTVSIGLTVAYFTDYEAARGGAVINLKGYDEIEEHFDGNDKVVSIKNTGETDLVVRVRAYGDNLTPNSAKNTDWAGDKDGSWWYYSKILKPGDSTSEIRFEVRGRVDPDDPVDFDVTVVQEAERVTYMQDDKGRNIVAAPEGWDSLPVIEADE